MSRLEDFKNRDNLSKVFKNVNRGTNRIYAKITENWCHNKIANQRHSNHNKQAACLLSSVQILDQLAANMSFTTANFSQRVVEKAAPWRPA
jgi:hypothetical protein